MSELIVNGELGVSDFDEPRPDTSHDVALLTEKLFVSLGLPGVYGRTALHAHITERLETFFTRLRPDAARELHFPPVMPRADVERSGYLKSFPHLLGCVSVLDDAAGGSDGAHRKAQNGHAWTDTLTGVDLVLAPAACYPVYPLAAREIMPTRGLTFDVVCDCFRREPSLHPDRLQSFRMREYVRIGEATDVVAFRREWMDRALQIATDFGLPSQIAPASDPFFGREGTIMGVSQLQQSLKFELLVPTWSQENPTACMSFNYHRDHFGAVWGIGDGNGGVAHTACVAFGLDRLVLALVCTHGAEMSKWPALVRQSLDL